MIHPSASHSHVRQVTEYVEYTYLRRYFSTKAVMICVFTIVGHMSAKSAKFFI